jgi:hypothetical protein
MSNKHGGITLGGQLGGWEIVNIPATALPQELASAIAALNDGSHLGVTFIPVWYVAKQLVNGVNYLMICEEVRATRNQDTYIVGVVLNVPPANTEGKKPSIVEIIEDAEMPDEVEEIFNTAFEGYVGVSYRPIIYIGKQVVKGMNYYFVAEARVSYPEAVPYAVTMTINQFGTAATVTEISPIEEPGLSCEFGK